MKSSDSPTDPVKSGLQYIADSPAQENGGFHPQTVETAKKALARIEELERDSPTRATPPQHDAPKVIYLQWWGADRADLTDEEFKEPAPHCEVTWCQHKINDTDLEYRLAEAALPSPPPQPIDKLLHLIRTWMETESGPTAKFSHPDLKVQVTIRGYKKLILERKFDD